MAGVGAVLPEPLAQLCRLALQEVATAEVCSALCAICALCAPCRLQHSVLLFQDKGRIALLSLLHKSAVKGREVCLSEKPTDPCCLPNKPTMVQEARAGLQQMVDAIRKMDVARGGGLTACADILQLYASTQHWLAAERGYKASCGH